MPSIQLRGEEESKHIRQEINIVIKTLINELATNLKLGDETRDRLETQLLEMEHHTYLWLHLAINDIYETLRDSFWPDEELIERLLAGIEDAYERILSKASKRTQNVKLILQFIVGAKRPLTVGEMAIALGVASKPQAVRLKDAILDKQNLGSQIRHWCGLFVFVSDTKIYLIHQTAKEFLIRRPDVVAAEGMRKHCLVPAIFEGIMAQVCVRLLLFPDIGDLGKDLASEMTFCVLENDLKGIEILLNHHGDIERFVTYSAGSWADHLTSTYLSIEPSFKTKVLQLYDTDDAVFNWWFPIFWITTFHEFISRTNALCLAALNGHMEIVCDILKAEPSSIDQRDSEGYSALILASQFGHQEVTQLLLSKGADIDAEDPAGCTPLYAASDRGHLDVVELLLSKGADINQRGSNHGTALEAASHNAHWAIVDLLISRGAVPRLGRGKSP